MLQECTESILVPEWNFPVYVKSSKDSEALQEFVKIPFGSLLKQDVENSLDEIIKKCQHQRFQFPGLSERLGSNHLERQDEMSDSIFYETPRWFSVGIFKLKPGYKSHDLL